MKELLKLFDDPSTIPSKQQAFRAFSYFDPADCKVIILGQDPYPNRSDACGLAFSIDRPTNDLPPSLKNIFIELTRDIGCKPIEWELP